MNSDQGRGETDIKVAYIVTSNGRDVHADMALVSILSMRQSNPRFRITVLLDGPSGKAVKEAGHPLLKVCDEVLVIETPDGQPTFRNRWIKTQLGLFVKGTVLYIDSDTLIRDDLSSLPNKVTELGGVPNHNGRTVSEQIFDGDLNCLNHMGWPTEFGSYINGGVLFYISSPAVEDFFKSWHELWNQTVNATGGLRDQPSLNTALTRSGIQTTVLPTIFNAQVGKNWIVSRGATVWHFYASTNGKTSFVRLTGAAQTESVDRLKSMVAAAIKAEEPWPKYDFISRWVIRTLSPEKRPGRLKLLWLTKTGQDVGDFLLRRFRRNQS